MIYQKVEASKYKELFIKKFTNYGEKAPIMISFATDDIGVTVIHENSGTKYFYEWDFTMDLKAFIHRIKQDLSNRHYPRITREEEITRKPTPEEIAEMIANGTSVDEVPDTITYRRVATYRIDKLIAMKDEFVIIDEETGEQYCYKMDGSGIYYLRNYRNNIYKDTNEAGEEFFRKCTLLEKFDKKRA